MNNCIVSCSGCGIWIASYGVLISFLSSKERKKLWLKIQREEVVVRFLGKCSRCADRGDRNLSANLEV